MIKKIFGITTLLFLSIFLIMPVYASDPGTYTKEIDIFPNDLDYRNSLVDWNGYNLSMEIIKDTAGGLDPQATHLYLRVDNVDVIILTTWDKLYPNDPQDYQYKLRMTSSQQQQILSLLFDRKAQDMDVQTGRNYIFIYTRNAVGNLNAFALYFRIYFTGLLDINFGSFYISDNVVQNYTGVLNNFTKGIMFKDKDGNILENITVDTSDTQNIATSSSLTPRAQQRSIYNFTNRITNIKSIDLVYQLSANAYDPRPQLAYHINEIGFFASEQVILPNYDIDTDFQIYEPTVCGILDLACVSRNLIGELSNTVYNRLGADSIASSILDIYDTLFYPVYIIENSSWQNAILAIYIMLPIGIIVMIIKRVT